MTGRSVSASAELRPIPAKRELEPESNSGILSGLRRTLAATLGGVLGSTEHANAQVDLAVAAPSEDAEPVSDDERIRRYAVTRAFRSVSSLFRWERNRARWVAVDAERETLTRFESQLAVHPVRGTADLPMLMRMLAAITRADGQFDDEERQFLAPFAAAGDTSVDELALQADPSSSEVGGIAQSRKDSVLMICWAAAYSDGHLEAPEQKLLERFAADLGIDAEQASELRNRAQYFLLERTLEEVFSDFDMSIPEEDLVIRMGGRLGLPLAETQNAIQRFRKRRGLA